MINAILIKGDPYQIRLEAWKGPWRASTGEGAQRHTARQTVGVQGSASRSRACFHHTLDLEIKGGGLDTASPKSVISNVP